VAGIDTIIPLGAVAAFISYRRVRPSIVDGSRNLMEAARENGVKKFVYGGTLLVYGSRKQPIDQATEPPRFWATAAPSWRRSR